MTHPGIYAVPMRRRHGKQSAGMAVPMVRSFLLVAAVSVAVMAAGCGSSSSSSKVPSAVATELSYFAPGTPFVASLQTKPQSSAIKNAEALLAEFPVGGLALTAVEDELPAGLSYQSDVKPLYGNPIMLGVLGVAGSASLRQTSVLAVWITHSAAKLQAILKDVPGLTAAGTDDGATVYGAGGAVAFAVDGPTLLFASSKADLLAALNRHAHGAGITTADFSKAMGSLPSDSLLETFGSLSSLLATPRAGTAGKIPWVAAIHSYAAAIDANANGLSIQFRLDTSGRSLTSAQLPIASGTAAPELAGSFPIVVALRDPAQSLGFIEAAAEAVDPGTFGQFDSRESAVKAKTGYDLNTFAALLTGDLVVETNLTTTMGRAQVSDPASAAAQLTKLPVAVRDIFRSAKGVKRLPGGFYAITGGRRPFDLGLVGDEFVAGVATPAQLKAFAAAPAAAAPGAQGSLAARITLLDLLRLTLKKHPGALVQSVLSTLGDVTGSATATPGAVTGQLNLSLR